MSEDLDLRSASFVQFNFRFGCDSLFVSPLEVVLLDMSFDGGITWVNLYRLNAEEHLTPK